MAVTIVATAGSASANSYALLTEAETFMEARLNASLWTAATDDSKNRALVEATRELTNLTYKGDRADTTQALAWPRSFVYNPDSPVQDYYDNTIVPQRIKDATCELAFQFIKAGTSDLAALDPTVGIVSKTVDVLSTTYDVNRRPSGLRRFPSVWRYVKDLLLSTGPMVPVIRG